MSAYPIRVGLQHYRKYFVSAYVRLKIKGRKTLVGYSLAFLGRTVSDAQFCFLCLIFLLLIALVFTFKWETAIYLFSMAGKALLLLLKQWFSRPRKSESSDCINCNKWFCTINQTINEIEFLAWEAKRLTLFPEKYCYGLQGCKSPSF